mgnify:CR=1 FL=1
MTHKTLLFITIIYLLLTSCQNFFLVTPSPMPGWRAPVYKMLADDTAFPVGWEPLSPTDTSTDPTANHVGRRWGDLSPKGSNTAEQAIWRAYTVDDAKVKYSELLKNRLNTIQPLPNGAILVPFAPPMNIKFQSFIANEFYLACGWAYIAYCRITVRYRNYVIDFRIDRKAEYNGVKTGGLTDTEIENLLNNMDAKANNYIKGVLTATP